MSTATFDKLLYLETLKASGIPDDQARAHAHALDEALRDSVATKADLREMELRVTVKVGAMIIALGGFLSAIKFFGH
jgi:hypothetical protein